MIVTAALLERGDVIKRFGAEHVVVTVDENYVYHIAKRTHKKTPNKTRYSNKIGIKSKEKIELIEPPEPPKEKIKFERIKGEYSNTTPFGIK